jgi:cytochrome c biogenesis protein CcmG, thiol:disulfide interchange protein DsbE
MRRRLLCLALVALALPACAERPSAAPRIGEPAPDFESVSLDGESLSLAELRGQPVLLNLWATWCGPCRTETPFLQAIFEEHRERGLRVVGVTVDGAGSIRQIHSFLDEFGVTYDILHDARMESMDTFSVWGLPVTYLIDRDGRFRFIRLGPIDEEDADFHAALEDILS